MIDAEHAIRARLKRANILLALGGALTVGWMLLVFVQLDERAGGLFDGLLPVFDDRLKTEGVDLPRDESGFVDWDAARTEQLGREVARVQAELAERSHHRNPFGRPLDLTMMGAGMLLLMIGGTMRQTALAELSRGTVVSVRLKCRSCERLNEEDATFCSGCGERL